MDFVASSLRSSSTVGETLCAVFIPLIGVVEAFFFSLTSCFNHHHPKHKNLSYSFEDIHIVRLANDSPFSINEIEALRELFEKLSSSINDDGVIHKDELRLALKAGENLFLDRVFDLFDEKGNGVIEFEEFVHALGVFHPCAPLEKKIDVAFRMYDLRQTGYIEWEEVREMVVAMMSESSMYLEDEVLKTIIDKTFQDADVDKDGKISKEEWRAFVLHRPEILKHMTLPHLEEITTLFTSFIFNTELDESTWKHTSNPKY